MYSRSCFLNVTESCYVVLLNLELSSFHRALSSWLAKVIMTVMSFSTSILLHLSPLSISVCVHAYVFLRARRNGCKNENKKQNVLQLETAAHESLPTGTAGGVNV